MCRNYLAHLQAPQSKRRWVLLISPISPFALFSVAFLTTPCIDFERLLAMLWETGLGDDGGTIVAQAFKENRAIRDLDLRYNEMGDKAGAALIDMLKTNTCLQKITLYRNPFSSVVKQSLKLDARV